MGERSPGHDRRELAADERIVVADAAGAPGEVDPELERCEHRITADGDRGARRRWLIALRDALERLRFGVRNQALTVHRYRIDRPKIAEALGIRRACGDFGETDRLERALDWRKKVRRPRRHLVGGSRDHLLGAAAGGNQADA